MFLVAEYPHFYADNAVHRLRFIKTVVNIGPKRRQGQSAFVVPLGARYFGAAETSARNLMLETATRSDRMGWSGHRVWLGPQSLWAWPPPSARRSPGG